MRGERCTRVLQCSLLWAAWPWFPAHAADLDILHGGVLLLGLALGFGLTWWFLRPSAVSEFPHASADNALPVILDTADGGFYYQNLQSGREEISHRLVQMLGLSQNAGGFNVFASLLDENSHVILRNAIMDLKKDKKDLYFHVLTKEGKKHLECCASSLPGMMGDVREIIVWFRDVTVQQKQITRIGRENEKLKLELKLFSSILNALPLPVWQRAEDLSIRYCNLAFSEAAEETPERVVEAEDLELHSYAKQLARIAKNAGELKSERRHMVVGGHRKLYQFTEIPMLPDPYLVGVAQDVTELELVQEELERHISAQKDFLESSASAMAVFGSDTRLRFFNFAFVRLWGLDEAWLGNQPTYSEVLEFLREKRRLPEQANFPVFKQQQLRLFTDLIEPREEFLYLPDGKTLRVLAIPHALGGVLFAYEDVTDRLALERSYNTLIAVQKATLDNLHEGVAVFGEDGRMRLCNPVYLKLWKLEDKTLPNGIHISEVLELTKPLYDFKQWDSYKQEMTNLLHQRKVTRQRLERTDGTVLDCIFVPLPDGATIITYFDVTEQRLKLVESELAYQKLNRIDEAMQACQVGL